MTQSYCSAMSARPGIVRKMGAGQWSASRATN
jgi:hypothetical protein